MNRNISKEALVISVRENARDNRTVTLLTKDGIEYSTLYGGPKSRLRGAVSPWNSGIMYFYNDGQKGTSKINDFDVKKYHATFRESLFKSFAASLAGEIAVKSKCAGSPGEAFFLLNGFLDGMDVFGEEEGRLGMLRFLWRYLGLLGVRPETETCIRCGGNFSTGNFGKNAVLYSAGENGFVCPDCLLPDGRGMKISVTSLAYLNSAEKEDMAAARAKKLGRAEYEETKALLFQMTESALGQRLKSIASGSGIL